MVNMDNRPKARLSAANTQNAYTSTDLLSSRSSIELNFVHNKLQQFQQHMLKDVEQRMSGMIDEVLQEIRQYELQSNEFKNFATPTMEHTNIDNTWSNRCRVEQAEIDEINRTNQSASDISSNSSRSGNNEQKKRSLPSKVFINRESYLTALLQVHHMKVIYNICCVFIVLCLGNGICYDYFVLGRVYFGLGTFKSGFAKLDLVLGMLCLKNLFACSIYYALIGWNMLRLRLPYRARSIWNCVCLLFFVLGQLAFGGLAAATCLHLNLPFVSASVLLLESTRLLMKMHAFVRSNVPRLLQGKLKADRNVNAAAKLAPFSSYLYFLFAPTLLYRDHYPRTQQIRWKFAAMRLLEIVIIAFLFSYLHERHIYEHFRDFTAKDLNLYTFIVKLSHMIVPGITMFLCSFYLVLHSWLNFTSELLRFGDRMFYKDWWTSNTYDAYYRNWNVVVHDWLYEYIYKDFYSNVRVFKSSKAATLMLVFFISAVVHEWIMGFALQIFCPVMFFFFWIVGMPMIFLTRVMPKSIGNVFLWFTLLTGNGLMATLYCLEYFAKQNCVRSYESAWDYLLPALWSCAKTVELN